MCMCVRASVFVRVCVCLMVVQIDSAACIYLYINLSVVRVPDTVNIEMSLGQSYLTKCYSNFSTPTMVHTCIIPSI